MSNDRGLTQENKNQLIAQALTTPQGRAEIGQTMWKNVAFN